ncbi:hypothetical protein UPYG_G00073370 [Umbra pygmaea]|uniref:CARD domain-containing protein n=1 Tax=Umbra pygmaea TaxID=75934 RepID=A0ABD0XRV7_UMBPY
MEIPITSDLDDPGPGSPPRGQKRTVKSHLLASRELLVASLYNLAPLLDRTLAAHLLSQENYFEVKAERTPQSQARKLLEVVQAEMDEAGARKFMECLRSCKQHYPCLRDWLNTDANIERGPTERQMQAQLSVLCSRLGYSVLPVSLVLFSNGTLTQFELDQIQAAPTTYQQTHQLLYICLAKGERACCSFYQALGSEDPHLASDIRGETSHGSGLEEALHAKVHLPSVVLEDPDVCRTSVEEKDCGICSDPVERSDHWECSTPIAVEETTESDGEGLAFPENDTLSGVLQQVLVLLAVTPGEEARLNVCELGVVLGLPRRTVRECLLDDVGVGDRAQLKALVALFLSKTQDASRLLTRMAESTAQRVMLSERGCLLLKLLLEAMAFLHAGTTDNHLCTGDHLDKVWSIFSFVLWDCMAEALEDPGAAAESCWEPRNAVRQLRGSERVGTELLQELEECWAEGGTDNLLQSIRVLAQVLRNLHPLNDALCLSLPEEGNFYPCRPRRLHRVTRFQGLPSRTIRKALGHRGPSAPTAPFASQYRELCLCITRLLNRVHPEDSTSSIDFSQAPIGIITQHILSTLERPAFGSQSFDAGVKHRIRAVVKHNPVQQGLPSLQDLHRETLSSLESYLKPGEQHSFQLVLEKVWIFGGAEIRWAERARGPVSIDNGIEEVLRFVTSEPASFIISVNCRGYDRGRYFEVCEPWSVRLTGLGESEVQGLGSSLLVLAAEGETLWVRQRDQGRGTELDQLRERHWREGCCFRVSTPGTQCQVKFIYKTGRISAVAEKNCEVV